MRYGRFERIVTDIEIGVLADCWTRRGARRRAARLNTRPGMRPVEYVVERRAKRWVVVAYQAKLGVPRQTP